MGRRCSCAVRHGTTSPSIARSPWPKACASSPKARLKQHSYQAQDGTNRTVVELQVDEIGPSLRYATAQVARISHQGGPVYGNPAAQTPTVNTGAGGWSQRPQQSAQTQQPAAPPADDPWGAPAADQSSFGDFGKPDPEPEF